MRLSVISDEISPDLDAALRVCEELAVRCVELRVVSDHNVVWHDAAGLRRAARALAAGGFDCPVIASPFLKTPRPEVEWEALERSFAAAHAVGAGIVRTFSWLRDGGPAPVEVLQEALERTAAAGLALALENEHACTVATGAESAAVLASIPDRRLGVIWDPGNEARLRLGPPAFPDGYAAVRDRVLHVHVKDAGPNGEWVRPGAGAVGWAGQLRALARDGYAGCLSVETHYTLPEGGREAATRECVAALRGIAAAAGTGLA